MKGGAVDFLGFLRGLFGGGGGGGQSAPAPPAQIPASIRRPAEQQAPAAPQRSQSFQTIAAPRQEQAPSQDQGWAPFRQINFSPPPANAPQPVNFQAPLPDGFSVTRGQEEAKKQVETKKAREEKSEFFGAAGEYAPEQMSVDAYLQLEPRQRAAVDANTALVQAAEQDIASWAKSSVAGKPIDDKDYLNQVNQSFGEAGGSDTYAPRTMAVLQDLGLNLDGRDLDQYLNRSALVTASDLDTLRTGAEPVSGDASRQNNAVAFSSAASNRLSETLASGQTLLDSLRTGSEQGAQLFGAPASADRVGFAQGERDADLAQAFDILSQTRSQQDLTPETIGGLYTELQEKHGVTPNEVAQYFETRLQANEYLNTSGDTDVTLGGVGSSLEYLAPQDFRSKFLTRGA